MSRKEPLLKTDEVAKFFAVTPRTVRNWVESGKLIPDIWGEHGGNNPHMFYASTVRQFHLDQSSVNNANIPPSDQFALANTEKVRLQNEQTKSTLVNRGEFVAKFFTLIELMVQDLKKISEEVELMEKISATEIDGLIENAMRHFYENIEENINEIDDEVSKREDDE